MTQAANWNTRWNVQKQHIVWRETFYETKFNIFTKAYAHLRMAFVNKDTIIGANCTLATHVRDYGTASKFAEAIGDTAFDARKGLRFTVNVRKILSWTIRAPFVVVGITAFLVGELCQAIITRLPGSVE
jgi:hypothetical protein